LFKQRPFQAAAMQVRLGEVRVEERSAFVKTPDGNMEVFVAHPSGGGAFAPVFMFQNVGGFSEMLRDMARRVAAEGYYCIVPDFYYRLGRIVIDPDSHDENILAIRKVASGTMRDNAKVMGDVRHVLTFIDADPAAQRGPMGTIGYCMGGRLSIVAAETFPERFTATTALFGTQLITDRPDSPHLGLNRIKGELYCGFADHDPSMPLEKVAQFKQLLQDNCTASWMLEIHPGTEHGYAFPGRKVYHEQASELDWKRTFEMFERQLSGSGHDR
jgi:carboxymethylenebutenolidase